MEETRLFWPQPPPPPPPPIHFDPFHTLSWPFFHWLACGGGGWSQRRRQQNSVSLLQYDFSLDRHVYHLPSMELKLVGSTSDESSRAKNKQYSSYFFVIKICNLITLTRWFNYIIERILTSRCAVDNWRLQSACPQLHSQSPETQLGLPCRNFPYHIMAPLYL